MQRSIQQRLVAEINHHLDAGTTTMADGEMRSPVREYVDPDRLAAERAQLFRLQPLVVGHRSQCPRPRDFFTEDVAGVPLLVTRQGDGSLKAFLNVCRHRGAKVALDECGSRRAFTCPYHAWSYRADGSLLNIPHDDGFSGIDRAEYGLTEVPVEERHGLVWVVPTPGAAIDVAAHLGPLDDELASYDLGGYVVERSTTLRAETNWKLVVDGFLESYHIRFLHARTIGPYIRTNLAPFEALGRHGRLVAVRSSFDEVRDRPPERVDLLPHVAVVYQIFPNTVLIWQADHFESWLVFPDGDRVDRSVSRVALLAPRPPASPDERGHWDKNWKILMETVLDEDFVVARTTQQGFASGAQADVTFGRNEPALQLFHRQLAHALGRP